MKANEKVTVELTRLELVMLASFAKTCAASLVEKATVGAVSSDVAVFACRIFKKVDDAAGGAS